MSPKADAGLRSVPTDEPLADLLRRHRVRQKKERMAAGQAWADTGYVFTDELGEPYRPEYLSRLFSRLAAAARLRRIRLHDTRHTRRRH